MPMLGIFKHLYDGSYSSHELLYCEGRALVKIQMGLPYNWCLACSDATAVIQHATRSPTYDTIDLTTTKYYGHDKT